MASSSTHGPDEGLFKAAEGECPILTRDFIHSVRSFSHGDLSTEETTRVCTCSDGSEIRFPVFVNSFWPRRQRAGSSLHRIAYRESFSPSLARFFIEGLSRPEEMVYDPYMGRGTTPIEAALLGRVPFGNDINPLSQMLVEPRLQPQFIGQVIQRLGCLGDMYPKAPAPPQKLFSLLHPKTLYDVCELRHYLLEVQGPAGLDQVDRWIRMLVLCCLSGPRSAYLIGPSLNPDELMLPTRRDRPYTPLGCTLPRKELFSCLRAKSISVTWSFDAFSRRVLESTAPRARLFCCPASHTPEIANGAVALIVTGPPGLRPLECKVENWLRCWFVDLKPESVAVSRHETVEAWAAELIAVLVELHRVLTPGGHLVLDLGRLRPRRRVRWDELIVECAVASGFEPEAIIVNSAEGGVRILERRRLTRRTRFDEVMVLRKSEINWSVVRQKMGIFSPQL